MTQLGQILIDVSISGNFATTSELDDFIERVLNVAVSEAPEEPLPYYLIGVMHSLRNQNFLAESFYRRSLDNDPMFEPSIIMLLRDKCRQRIHTLTINPLFLQKCCWPSEQNVYCFKNKHRVDCFRIKPDLTSLRCLWEYFRCNTPYSGISYRPPPFAEIISPLLCPLEELKQFRTNVIIENIVNRSKKSSDSEFYLPPPVFPLDYGGYSLGRMKAHQRSMWPEDLKSFKQLTIEWPSYNIPNDHSKHFNPTISSSKELNRNYAAFSQIFELSKMSELRDFDVQLSKEVLPRPHSALTKKGQEYSKITEDELAYFCKTSNTKWKQLLNVSTYISPTVKGALTLNEIIGPEWNLPFNGTSNLEPVCPELPSSTSSAFLEELDKLPAYRFRHYLKFYHPEKALRDTLLNLYGRTNEKIEQISERLHHSLARAQKESNYLWALTTLAALYWRVKGDAIEAIKCLRHSIHNSSVEFRDVPLITLASIYHQSGFSNSALIVASKALEISPNSVVAIHWSIGNILASMGEYSHAIDFYYSTLALQSNFQTAKERIWAIRCTIASKGDDTL